MEIGSVAWRELRDMRQTENEDIHEYILKWETAEANVKANAGEISDEILVIQLLDSVNVTTMERQNIVSYVRYENNSDYYKDIKKAVKLLKGSLVANKMLSEKDSSDKVFYNK